MRPTSTLLPSIVRCAATVSPSHPELTHQRTHFPDQLGNLSPPLYRLAGIAAVPPVVAVATRRSGRWAAVHPAALPAAHRGGLAWRPAPRLCTAPGRRVHGVDLRRKGHLPPLPPGRSTAPTTACPPSFTVTCSTRTVCCPDFPRWRFTASIRVANVRLRRFAWDRLSRHATQARSRAPRLRRRLPQDRRLFVRIAAGLHRVRSFHSPRKLFADGCAGIRRPCRALPCAVAGA